MDALTMLKQSIMLAPWDRAAQMAYCDEVYDRSGVDPDDTMAMLRREIVDRVEDMVTAHGDRAKAIRAMIRARVRTGDRTLIPVVVYTESVTGIVPHIAYVTVRDVTQALRFDRHGESRYGRMIRHRVGEAAECIAVGVDWLLAHPEILMAE